MVARPCEFESHPAHQICSMSKGEMAEWSIAAVLKTVELRGSGGSNPSLSAKKRKEFREGAPFLFLRRHRAFLFRNMLLKRLLLLPRTGALISALPRTIRSN